MIVKDKKPLSCASTFLKKSQLERNIAFHLISCSHKQRYIYQLLCKRLMEKKATFVFEWVLEELFSL